MKPITVPRLERAASRYYELHPAGGSLHIVLDDRNIKRGHVAWCLEYALKNGDTPGAMLARGLLRSTISQRKRLTSRGRY